MMFDRKNKDLRRMEGKKLNIDTVMTVLCFVLLIIVAICPVGMIVYNACWDTTTNTLDLAMFKEVLLQKENIGAMKNTIVIGFMTTLIATLIGVFFAWLLGRSDIPMKGTMRWLFKIPFMIPPFLGAMAWDIMFSARGGYVNRWFMSTFGLEKPPFNVNTVIGIIIVEAIYMFPFVYNQVVAALERMDPTLEESARIAGAKQMYVITRITLPLVVPAISSGMLLVLITSLANYGIPSMLGFSAKIYTLPTRITERMEAANGSFIGIRQATILSILLIIVVGIALIMQNRLLNVGRYDIIKGKSMRPTLIKLRKAKYPLLIFSMLFLVIVVLAPLAMIIITSFLKAYGLPIRLENFSLKNYHEIFFRNNTVATAAKNSLFLGFSAGFICLFLGVMLSFVIYKVKPKGRGLLEFMAVLPYSLPGTVLAIGCILAWSGAFKINLYNTIWIILIAYAARYLSYTLKSCSASLQQVHPSLEEASRMCGASRLQSLTDVTMPLIKPAMISSFFLVFLPAMRELTTSVLLVGPKSKTLGVTIYQYRAGGHISTASALAVVTIAIIMICNAVIGQIVKDRKGI
ncbi:MAG: iron ABC transporter permease [Sphaerochaetaceae bacterium]|nr:iron ABC transporter permease [Sphaerochaetaceae bacterium]